MMARRYILASLTAGVSLAGAQAALCAEQARGGGARPISAVLPSKGLNVAGGAASKALSDTYMKRLMRFIQLMNPVHTLTTERDIRRYEELLRDHKAGKKRDWTEKDVEKASGEVDACCNPSNGEVIPAPFRLSGFLVCNVPIVAAMLFTNSIYVQIDVVNLTVKTGFYRQSKQHKVLSHWINQSLNTAVNYYNRSGAEMSVKTVATSYALAVGTACPLAFGLAKAFKRAPAAIQRYSFIAPYGAIAAAGSMNVLFTRASEISGGVKVTDESGAARGISKKAGLLCVLQTIASRGLILPLPVVVLPAVFVRMIESRGMMPPSPRARLWVQLAAITASLAIAVPVSIAVFPQEARFKASSLEPEFHNLSVKGGSRKDTTYLYANKGL